MGCGFATWNFSQRMALSRVCKQVISSGRMLPSITAGVRLKHTLPNLPYDYGALEPVISADIMRLHHEKHHATYVNNLNNAEEQLKKCVDSGDVGGAIALQPAVKFNGGGHINHSIFWENLSLMEEESLKGYNKESNRLQIATCLNQDPLLATTGLIPLLGIDVWEHAYYLQYKNVRPDYVKAIWSVVNWSDVADRFASARN